MRLRTFETFWLLKNGLLYTYPMLQQNITTEIAVIGGGITGALISHALMEAGYEVTILDRRDIGQGSTSATTSMLQYEIDTSLVELSGMIGEAGAARCYHAGIDAIRKLEKMVKQLDIDCGFRRNESLYIAHNKSAERDLKQECELRDQHKLGVTWLSPSQSSRQFGVNCHGAILSEWAASVDAYKLAHELIAHNVKRGMRVFDQTQIKKFDCSGRHPVIHTAEGHLVKARTLVFCSGFEATELLTEHLADLIYTYACISEQNIKVNRNLQNVLVWDTNDPYLYMRMSDDGRLLVGGEDSPFSQSIMQQEIKKRKAAALLRKLAKVIPGVNFIEDFNWGGVFGTTKDGLPYIGSSPELKNAYFVLGFGGNGITFSIQGMEILPALLAGEDHDLAHYYRFGR